MNCRICGRSTFKAGTNYLSFGSICDECKADETRRRDAGLCLRCGENEATTGGWDDRVFCAGCADGGEYRNYPGPGGA